MSSKWYSDLWGPGDNHQMSPTICKTYDPSAPQPCMSPPGYRGPSSRKLSVISSGDESLHRRALCFHFWVLFLFSLFLSISVSLYLCPVFVFFYLLLSISVSILFSLSLPLSLSLLQPVSQPLSPPLICLSSLCFLVSWHSLPLPGDTPGSVSFLSQPLCCLLSPSLCLCRSVALCAPPLTVLPPFPPLLVHVASADEMEPTFLQRAGQETAVSTGRSS